MAAVVPELCVPDTSSSTGTLGLPTFLSVVGAPLQASSTVLSEEIFLDAQTRFHYTGPDKTLVTTKFLYLILFWLKCYGTFCLLQLNLN